jgi:hypothetical protein
MLKYAPTITDERHEDRVMQLARSPHEGSYLYVIAKARALYTEKEGTIQYADHTSMHCVAAIVGPIICDSYTHQ